jgi:4-hydroxy-tetrahydrodipicolinate reductase
VLSLILYGAHGRMAGAVERVALEAGDVRIKARIDRPAVPAGVAGPDPGMPEPAAPGDVVVDFSTPEGTLAACRLCAASGAALVSGTTGLGPGERAELEALSRRVAVLHAANFSLGVLALRRAVAAALAAAPGSWDVEIVERHHRRKADAPSGTALALARDVAAARGLAENAFRHGREGRVGERPPREIGIHAVRGGSWVGDHVVLLAGEGEWLELRHVAQDRTAFAQGALAAARFVSRAAPGTYNLENVAGVGA